MKPKFSPGKNIAIKVPTHEFESMLNFYKVILGLKQKDANSLDESESVTFEFGEQISNTKPRRFAYD